MGKREQGLIIEQDVNSYMKADSSSDYRAKTPGPTAQGGTPKNETKPVKDLMGGVGTAKAGGEQGMLADEDIQKYIELNSAKNSLEMQRIDLMKKVRMGYPESAAEAEFEWQAERIRGVFKEKTDSDYDFIKEYQTPTADEDVEREPLGDTTDLIKEELTKPKEKLSPEEEKKQMEQEEADMDRLEELMKKLDKRKSKKK